MDDNKEIKFHASSTGRSHIEEKEFFKTEKVKNIIDKLLESSIYKDLKRGSQSKVSTS